MALTEKERLYKLKKAETGKDYHDLYVEVFGTEYPETATRDPNEDIEKLIQAIYEIDFTSKTVEHIFFFFYLKEFPLDL